MLTCAVLVMHALSYPDTICVTHHILKFVFRRMHCFVFVDTIWNGFGQISVRECK